MKVMLFGSTGYLGHNILERLLREKNIFLTIPVRNTEKLYQYFTQEQLNDVDIVSCDLTLLEYLLRKNSFDFIINTICTYKENERSLYADMFESNLVFPLSVLNLAIKYNVKKFLTIGTSLSRDMNVYSFSKSLFSDFGKFLSEQKQIDFIELKMEMFFGGKHESTERFIRNCLMKMKKNESLQLTPGTQIRDMIRVEDVVEIITEIIKKNRKEGYQQLSLGYGEAHSIRETVEYMKRRMKSESELCFGALPMRIGEKDSVADISWLDELGYKFKYSWSSGLDKEVEEIQKCVY
jgi:CDP-paratose synthetase